MKITVVGSGIMGSGIAQACAMAKLDVAIHDINQAQIEQALVTVKKSLERFERKEKLSESIETIMERIIPFASLEAALDGSSLVIEAVVEDLEMKQELFRQFDELTSDDVILGTNTSQVSITSIASVVKNPGRVVGIHFFNPAPMMKLIEIIRGMETTDETVQKVQEFSKMLKKETVVCKKDRNGFLTSRLSLAFRAEAIRMLEEGVGTVEDIDKACRLGFNHPMGPFELNDFNGLDTSYKAYKQLEEVYGERFKVPQILENMVNANRLGRKTGRGWYEYE